MRFSLILCTVNREREVKAFLASLTEQTYKDFEVIIVDQNSDNRLKNLLNSFESINIRHIYSGKGLSKARNRGLKEAKGEILAFPDDDCTYPPKLVENMNTFFKTEGYDIVLGKTIDKKTQKIVAGKNVTQSQPLKPSLILGSSTTLFIRNRCYIVFDEMFGLGAVFNAEEENELVFRLLKMGCKGFYAPDINYVYHPASDLDYTDFIRAKKRAVGLGAFIAKHLFSKEGFLYFIKYNLFRPSSAAVIYALQMDFVKSKYYFNRWIGIWLGFLKFFESRE